MTEMGYESATLDKAINQRYCLKKGLPIKDLSIDCRDGY
jgi:hypothetical protein